MSAMSAETPPLRPPLVAAALVAGGISITLPLLAVAGVLACVVLTAAARGKERWITGLGLALCFAGVARFIVNDGARAIVLAGRRSGEEKAVSRLREIQWAESMAMEGGRPALSMGAMLATPGLLPPDRFAPLPDQPTRFTGDGYVFEVHVEPSDPARYYLYAWPRDAVSGTRLFFGDEWQRVCEAPVGPRPTFVPPGPYAALASASPDAARCAGGTDGRTWRPWRNKAAQPGATDPSARPRVE
jgi:hypothetical protein